MGDFAFMLDGTNVLKWTCWKPQQWLLCDKSSLNGMLLICSMHLYPGFLICWLNNMDWLTWNGKRKLFKTLQYSLKEQFKSKISVAKEVPLTVDLTFINVYWKPIISSVRPSSPFSHLIGGSLNFYYLFLEDAFKMKLEGSNIITPVFCHGELDIFQSI